jgi:RNA recognition motif-containing protein
VTMNLFVSNLNPETRADGLKTLFSEFGEVVVSKVIFDIPTGASRGFGFVEMADKNQGFDAIDNLDCSYFEGNIISVKEAKQSNSKPGGGGNNFKSNKPKPRPGGYNNQNFNRL